MHLFLFGKYGTIIHRVCFGLTFICSSNSTLVSSNYCIIVLTVLTIVVYCFTFKTVSVMKEQLEQLTKKYRNVTPVHMDVLKHEEKLSSLVKKHNLVIRSDFCVKHDRLNPKSC